MEITMLMTGENTELVITGRMDTITSSKLLPFLTEAIQSSETVTLNFAEVKYVSSAGLRVLLQGQKIAQSASKSLKLENVSPDVMEIFEVTGFSAILTIV
ncbi:MAG: STAS domain-containing protein [Defluviitaleaceae bacterium]|nr:STAS domain-containing protein [Defluviitaleaceae bacterium]